MKKVLFSMFIVFCSCIISCATLFSGGNNQSIRINTNPSGAKIIIDGENYGTTPATISLSKKDAPYYVILKKEGYEDGSFQIKSTVGGKWIVLDVIGGIYPIIVDLLTKDWNELNPKNKTYSLIEK